eukprot:scaffold6314_cov163-Skeletonema_menzelii.AAC.3
MSPSEIAVQDGKQGNAKRLGDSCTVSLSIAKIVASTEDYLRDLKKNHKKKSGMFGSSQCDNARKGKKV